MSARDAVNRVIAAQGTESDDTSTSCDVSKESGHMAATAGKRIFVGVAVSGQGKILRGSGKGGRGSNEDVAVHGEVSSVGVEAPIVKHTSNGTKVITGVGASRHLGGQGRPVTAVGGGVEVLSADGEIAAKLIGSVTQK